MDEFDIELEELYSERAAIMHFDGGLPKEKADALAMAEVQNYMAHQERLRRIEEAGQG